MNNILDKIIIKDSDCIRGNITLPEKIDDTAITWKSSLPDIISDTDNGFLKKGLVNRGAEDVKVTLTASADINGKIINREFNVNVLKKPVPLRDEDFGGYLFAHFIGEQTSLSEQIYFAVSEDGLNFKDLNNLKPVLISEAGEKGVRDPYLYRSPEGDRFFLIATDLSIHNRGGWYLNEQGYYDPSTTGSSYLIIWESLDLINWTGGRAIKVAPKNAGMAWAPEMIYYEKTGEYLIYFSSSIMNPLTKYKDKPNTIYYVTTRDFIHFSDTKIFIDCQKDDCENPLGREIIDTTLIKIGDYYYSASKDGDNAEKCGGIRILKTRDLLDSSSWEKVLDLDEIELDLSGVDVDVLDNSTLEGPELFRYNKKDWADSNVAEYGLMADRYAHDSGYLPLKTFNIESRESDSWKLLPPEQYSFDKLKKRHGTIMNITYEEYNRLISNFGSGLR